MTTLDVGRRLAHHSKQEKTMWPEGPFPPMQERLEGLASFLPAFEANDFTFGQWGKVRHTEDGTPIIPLYQFGDVADRFMHAMYDLGWVLTDFDWVEWSDSPEANQLMEEEAIARASSRQLAKLITAMLRAERFCEGSLSANYQNGCLTAIAKRAAELAQTGHGDDGDRS